MRVPGLNDLTLRQLQYVVAVADDLGFRRAAERCHVSQPALSAQVRELEEALGVALFERDPRGVLLTPAGEELIPRARRVLTEAADLAAAAAQLGDPLAGTLRVGVIPTIAPYLLPEVAPTLHERFPRLRLLWREDKTESVVRGLAEGRLDAGLIALEEVQLGDLAREVIAADPFLLAAPEGHPLARRRRVHPDELAGAEVLLLDDGHCFRDQALAVCARAVAHEATFRATSLATLAQVVAGGAGVTLLPALAAPVENRRGRLVLRRFVDPAPHRTIALVWRPRSPLADALREVARALAAAWPGGKQPPARPRAGARPRAAR